MSAIPVLTPAQAQQWDHLAESGGRPLRVLMEQAGRAVAQLALERFGRVGTKIVQKECVEIHDLTMRPAAARRKPCPQCHAGA